MKLPRWLVISMLTSSVLAVLAAAGWWWVTWPERTAREFTALLAEGRIQRANEMMMPVGGNVPVDLSEEQWQLGLRLSPFQLQPRTALDLLRGRQDFKEVGVVVAITGVNVHGKSYQFTAQRGTISVRQTGDWLKMPSGLHAY